MPLQRYRVKSFFDKLEAIFETHKCDALIDLGDTTDDRSFIPRATLEILTAGLSRFSPNKDGIKLTGNHEQLFKYTDVNSCYLFEPYFGHIDEPFVKLTKTTAAVCQPFHEDYDAINTSIEASLKMMDGCQHKILFAHGDVRGVKYDSGESCKKGIDPTLIDRFDLALLGHVHRHQKFGKNAYYVGSPFQQDFGEAGQRKFVAILDCTSELKLEWVEIKGMPEYKVVSQDSFINSAKPDEEHRYWVTLSSIEETEQFYASPLSVLGTPKLTYSAQLGAAVKEESELVSDRQLLERYVSVRPISGVPEDVARDLVDVGEILLT
jgi:DNA repair exonuclease SbcCD nuclease subunit